MNRTYQLEIFNPHQQLCQTVKEATEDFISLADPYKFDPYWSTALREISKLPHDLNLKDRLDALVDIAAEHIIQVKDWPIFRKRADRWANEYGVTLKPDIAI